jgi:hypothetical protein
LLSLKFVSSFLSTPKYLHIYVSDN